jgi:hypothetical protein
MSFDADPQKPIGSSTPEPSASSKPRTSLAEIVGRIAKRVIATLNQAEPDAAEVWRRRSDEQVMAAMWRLEDYDDEGQAIIRAEMLRRAGSSIPDHPAIHVYVVRNPIGGMMVIFSVLPVEVAFNHGTVSEAVVGSLRKPSDDGGTLTPDNFDANPLFADFLHDVIARHGPDQPELIEGARREGSGKVYVIDGRARTSGGAVVAADVIGSFGVDGGVVIAGSYERNFNHTVLSETGFFRLSPALHERLAAELACRTVQWAASRHPR